MKDTEFYEHMKDHILINQLENLGPATKENRQRLADIVLANDQTLDTLMKITFQVDDKVSIKAAWILEWICTHHGIEKILPHLSTFTSNLHRLQYESAIRPCAKICEQLALHYDAERVNEIQNHLTKKDIKHIVESGFDWLLTSQKIAVKAYSMNTLFIFGKYLKWIHPELLDVIKTKVINQSKGCEARGKHVIKAIEKHQQRQ